MPFYKGQNWDTEKLSDLPSITHLASGQVRIWTQHLDSRAYDTAFATLLFLTVFINHLVKYWLHLQEMKIPFALKEKSCCDSLWFANTLNVRNDIFLPVHKWNGCFFLLFFFKQHIEVPRPGTELSHRCDLRCSCSNAASFNPLRRAKMEPALQHGPTPLQSDSFFLSFFFFAF